jgi:hypothetical protein
VGDLAGVRARVAVSVCSGVVDDVDGLGVVVAPAGGAVIVFAGFSQVSEIVVVGDEP